MKTILLETKYADGRKRRYVWHVKAFRVVQWSIIIAGVFSIAQAAVPSTPRVVSPLADTLMWLGFIAVNWLSLRYGHFAARQKEVSE